MEIFNLAWLTVGGGGLGLILELFSKCFYTRFGVGKDTCAASPLKFY